MTGTTASIAPQIDIATMPFGKAIEQLPRSLTC